MQELSQKRIKKKKKQNLIIILNKKELNLKSHNQNTIFLPSYIVKRGIFKTSTLTYEKNNSSTTLSK